MTSTVHGYVCNVKTYVDDRARIHSWHLDEMDMNPSGHVLAKKWASTSSQRPPIGSLQSLLVSHIDLGYPPIATAAVSPLATTFLLSTLSTFTGRAACQPSAGTGIDSELEVICRISHLTS